MKKLLILLALSVLIIATVTACGNETTTAPSTTAKRPTVTTVPGTTTVANTTAKPKPPVVTTDEFGNSSADILEEVYTENGFTYVIFKNAAKLVSYTGNEANVTVPATVKDKAVTSIATSAFKSLDTLESVTVSEGITTFGSDVFYSCVALKTVTLPSTLTTMGDGTFRLCSALESVAIPSAVKTIGNDTFYYCTKLTNVTLPAGMTFIPKETFAHCTALQSITLPESITTIGENAFYHCTSLESFTFTEKMVALGDKAFYNCTSLKAVNLPESITSVPNYAFFNCSSLTEISFGSRVSSIGAYSFYGCLPVTGAKAETTITLPDSLVTLRSGAFAYCEGLTTITIPNTIKQLNDRIFYHCSNLKTVIFAEDITKIGAAAFSATGLTSFTLPSTVSELGISAFSDCEALTSFTFEEGTSIVEIAASTFRNCKALTAITIPEEIITIANAAFSGCKSLQTVHLSSQTVKLELNAFLDCDIQEIRLPDTLTHIGGNAVGMDLVDGKNIPHTTTKILAYEDGDVYKYLISPKVNFPKSNIILIGKTGYAAYDEMVLELIETVDGADHYRIVGYTGSNPIVKVPATFTLPKAASDTTADKTNKIVAIGAGFLKGNETVVEVTLPAVTEIGESAFEGCTALKTINSPSSLTVIGNAAFKDTALEKITFYGQLTTIGDSAFENCKALTSVTTSAANAITTIGNAAFKNSGIISISFKTALTSIGNEAFADCTDLLGVTLQGPAPTVGTDVLKNTSPLTAFHVPEEKEGKETYIFADDAKTNWNGYHTSTKPANGVFKTFEFKKKESDTKPYVTVNLSYNGALSFVGATAKEAFSGFNAPEEAPWYEYRNYITTLSLSKIQALGNYACHGLNAITEITFSGPNVLTEIGEYTFAECSQLNKINLTLVTKLGQGAFKGTSLTTATLNKEITKIPAELFTDCTALTEIIFNGSITEIGNASFKNTGLTGMSLPKTVTLISDEAFMDCQALTAVTLFAKTIGNSAFENCSVLESLVISKDSALESIGNAAFKNTAIKDPTFRKALKSIGNEAFANCPNVVEVTLEGNAPTLGADIFAGNPVYAHFFCNKDADNPIWAQAGYSVTKSLVAVMKQFELDNGKLIASILYNGKMEIMSAERAKSQDKNATYPVGVIPNYTSADETPWADYRSFIKSLSIQDVSVIGSYAFSGLDKINAVTLPQSVTTVGYRAFAACPAITTVTSSAVTVGEEAFADCEKLVAVILSKAENFGTRAFANCIALTNVTITSAEGLVNAKAANAFENTVYGDTIN